MKKKTPAYRIYMTAAAILSMIVSLLYVLPASETKAAAASVPGTDIYARAVPNIDTNLTAAVTRQASPQQLAAADSFKAAYGSNAVVRWTAGNKLGAEFAEPVSLEGFRAS